MLAGAKVISGETLLAANLGFGLKLVSQSGSVRHTILFDTGPEGAIFIRNCANLGVRLGEVEAIAVTHGHWDHMAALPHAVDAIVKDGGQVTVHVNPGMFNDRAVRLKSGMIVPVANVPRPADLEQRGAKIVNSGDARLLLDGHFYLSGEIPRVTALSPPESFLRASEPVSPQPGPGRRPTVAWRVRSLPVALSSAGLAALLDALEAGTSGSSDLGRSAVALDDLLERPTSS